MELINLNKNIKELENLKFKIKNKNLILKELKEILRNSVENNIKIDNFGIAFSGGVDSNLIALLCKNLKKNFKLYTIGIGESDDLVYARKAASYLKLPIITKNIDFDEALEIIKKVCKLLKTDNPVQIGIGCTFYSVFELAKNDNIKHIITGLGSDTLFFGFEKHKKAFLNGEILKEFKESLRNVCEVDIKRDLRISKHFNLELICPYLDKELIKYSIRIDPKLKINNEEKKIILRELAYELGLKREFAYRKKVAAQYGSGFDKAIEVLAKENGFKTKTEFLKSLRKNK